MADKTEKKPTDGEIIASKSADVDAKSTTTHEKVFVVALPVKPTEANGFDHAANKAATIQYALSAGLRPTGDVMLKSTEKNQHGGSVWDLTYAVPVQLATDYDPETDPVYVVKPGEDAPANTDGAGHSK